MNRERTRYLVRGILTESGIDVARQDEGDGYLISEGSAVVAIDFYDWADAQSVVSIHADVLIDVALAPERRLAALETLNARNLFTKFGKFFLDEDRAAIVLEYDLLAEGLDAEELLNALQTIAKLADRSDDELREVLETGMRAVDFRAHQAAEEVRAVGQAEG